MQAIGAIVFILIGLIQMAAAISGLEHVLGIPTIVACILSFFLTWIPLIGTALGIWGAVSDWHWPWYGAAALFFWQFLIFISMMLTGAAGDLLKRRRVTSGGV